jgi:D-alanine-D-alanine ligase
VSRKAARVAVLYNAPVLPPEHPEAESEFDVVRVARAVVAALKSRGFKAWGQPAREPIARLVRGLTRKRRPDVAFNLVEGFAGRSGGEAWVTSLLELLGIPYTGCPPEAQGLCRHKGRTKALLLGAGLPTARHVVLGPGEAIPDSLPDRTMLVKPEDEDASLGIDQSSVVTSRADLAARVEAVRMRHGPDVLVEEYLPGLEFNVGVLGLPEPVALPVAEVVFDPAPGAWPILTYAAKWDAGSAEDRASPVRCPAEIGDELASRLSLLAVSAFRATGCRDYARVDFRLDGAGEPMILEVNPNPDIGPSAGLARALGISGRDYGETLAALVRQALKRGPRRD